MERGKNREKGGKAGEGGKTRPGVCGSACSRWQDSMTVRPSTASQRAVLYMQQCRCFERSGCCCLLLLVLLLLSSPPARLCHCLPSTKLLRPCLSPSLTSLAHRDRTHVGHDAP
jgi:hypothetical protein